MMDAGSHDPLGRAVSARNSDAPVLQALVHPQGRCSELVPQLNGAVFHASLWDSADSRARQDPYFPDGHVDL